MMKRFTVTVLLGLLAVTPGLAADSVTNNATLTLLASSFANATYVIGTNRHIVAIRWLSKADAQNCQRPLDLYLESNHVGGFVNPPMDMRLPGTRPLLEAIVHDLKVFLKREGIREDDIIIDPGCRP